MDCEDERDSERCYLVGEEEAIWLLRLVLPYINEVLLNLRSLFSGEPATTMKVKPKALPGYLERSIWHRLDISGFVLTRGHMCSGLQLALLLFAMARCGNFVTLWTLAKLGKYHRANNTCITIYVTSITLLLFHKKTSITLLTSQ